VSKIINIGALAKKTGVLVSTIRFYERIGLLPEPIRSESGYRIYSQETVDMVLFIKNAQQLEFTLKEIKLFSTWNSSKNTGLEHGFTRLQNKLLSIQKKIDQLEITKQLLQRLLESCPIFINGGNCNTNDCVKKSCSLIKNIRMDFQNEDIDIS
jgi:MerR family transcriptional regulator, mercuric resistance operon regulatory protein